DAQEISNLKIERALRAVIFNWSEPENYDFDKIKIVFDEKEIYVSKGVKNIKIEPLLDNKEYNFNIKIVKLDGTESQGVLLNIITISADETYLPYIGPYLTLLHPETVDNTQSIKSLNPSTNIIVNYESQIDNLKAKLYFRKKGDSDWSLAHEDDFNDNIENYGKTHHITLSNLSPNSIYEYQIYGGESKISKIYSFKTAGVNDSFSKFLIIGDCQDEEDKQRWGDIANEILSKHMDDFDFILSIGDMVKDDISNNNERFYWWRVFFTKGRDIFASKPIFPTIGNHDTPENPNIIDRPEQYWSNAENTFSFRKYFYIKQDMSIEDYYSFNYGDSYFIALNSEIPVFYGRYPQLDTHKRVDRERNWAQAEVNSSQRVEKWRFVFSHMSPFNPSGGKDDEIFVKPFMPIFDKKIDWYFTGHVHTYQRMRAIEYTNDKFEFKSYYNRESNGGVGYLIVPPSGQWPRFSNAPELETQTASYPQYKGNTEGREAYEIGFVIVKTDGDKIDIKTYGMGDVDNRNSSGYDDNGQKKLIDSISYRKKGVLNSNFPNCYYRGSSNGWKKTAMTLVDHNLWEITVLATSGENPAEFKFYTEHSGEKWYGDSDKDGLAHSNEENNIPFSRGAGTYIIKFNDSTRVYQTFFIE
ncbi:metallophosphoesterase family protein, partial [bacterium]|nr:metallophosphoesterase family protein [bacterium]